MQEALQHFERAVRVSGGDSVEGRLGAADVRLRVQHYPQAEELFAAVAQVHWPPFVSVTAAAHQATGSHLSERVLESRVPRGARQHRHRVSDRRVSPSRSARASWCCAPRQRRGRGGERRHTGTGASGQLPRAVQFGHGAHVPAQLRRRRWRVRGGGAHPARRRQYAAGTVDVFVCTARGRATRGVPAQRTAKLPESLTALTRPSNPPGGGCAQSARTYRPCVPTHTQRSAPVPMHSLRRQRPLRVAAASPAKAR